MTIKQPLLETKHVLYKNIAHRFKYVQSAFY